MSFNVLDLFPVCQAASCPERGQHKHPLPHQLAVLHDNSKFLLLKGGVGAAKTLAMAIACYCLLSAIPGNRGFIGRRTYAKLHDSTQRIFMEVLERARLATGVEPLFRENRDGFPHRIIFPNDSELFFRETKDIGRWLGPEYGFFWIDEAMEEPETTFTGLRTRLRLPHVGPYLKGLLSTNPPHKTHWLARTFGDTDGTIEVLDPSTGTVSTYRRITASTRANPHLPPGYLGDLMTGLSKAEIARIVEGDYGFSPEGPPAYPQFRHERNVGAPEVREGNPLIRGWDFGHRHPACTWHQTWRCEKRRTHWFILAELDATQIEAEAFASLVLREHARLFPHVPATLLLDAGDRAGARVDDHGPGPIFRLAKPPFHLTFRWKKCDVDLDPIRRVLKTICGCGLPLLVIHHRCRNVIDGFAGGYHLHPTRPSDDPIKDGFYDDFMDSVRYAWENFIKLEMASAGTLETMTEGADTPLPAWAWMGGHARPDEMAAEIAHVKRMMRRG